MLVLTPPKPACKKPAARKAAPKADREPLTEVIDFDERSLTGTVVIADEPYFLRAVLGDGAELLGWRLVRRKPDGTRKKIDLDATEQHARCDCEDATYRPERAYTCKHCAALAQFGFVAPLPKLDT